MNKITLRSMVAELIGNGDDVYDFQDEAEEVICYVQGWLRHHGYWQAADFLLSNYDQLAEEDQ